MGSGGAVVSRRDVLRASEVVTGTVIAARGRGRAMRAGPGVVMLALGGVAWFAVAVVQGRPAEMVFCGLTLTGFGTVLAGLRWSAPRGVIAAGFAVAASSNVAVFW